MRILFSDPSRPKAAAKWLSRTLSEVKLSAALEAIARATGYRDWHELSTAAPAPLPSAFDLQAARHVILAVVDALSLPAGDVQYAIARSRLLGSAPWRLDDHLTLTTQIWRERVFGAPARGKPGTVVKVRANGEARRAYLRRAGRPTHVVYDTGFGICADFEAVMPRLPLPDFIPSRLWVPYGFWTLQDGSEVIFARDYLPMWRISDSGVERLEPWLWIDRIAKTTIYSSQLGTVAWEDGPAQERAMDHLARHRIFELPKLIDAMPHLVGNDDATIRASVERLRRQVDGGNAPPSYARLNQRLA